MRDLFSLLLPWPIGEQTIVWLASRQSRTVLLPVPTPLGREVCWSLPFASSFFFFFSFHRVASRHHRGGRAGTRWRISLPGTRRYSSDTRLEKELIRNRSTREEEMLRIYRFATSRQTSPSSLSRGTINEAIMVTMRYHASSSSSRLSRFENGETSVFFPSLPFPSLPILLDSHLKHRTNTSPDRTELCSFSVAGEDGVEGSGPGADLQGEEGGDCAEDDGPISPSERGCATAAKEEEDGDATDEEDDEDGSPPAPSPSATARLNPAILRDSGPPDR